MIEFLAASLNEFVRLIFYMLVILGAPILVFAMVMFGTAISDLEGTIDASLAAIFSMFSTGLLMLLFAVYIYVEFIR